MTEPYPDVVARFYDVVYAKVRDGVDNEWYLDRMASADGPSLEIGVGTGRLFAEARRRGLDVPNLTLLLEGLSEHTDFDGEYASGRRVRRLVTAGPADLARQTTPVRMTFVWDEEDGEHRGEWAFDMRFFFRFEIEHLVARSTLALESIRGDFAGAPLSAGSREYIVTCQRPVR